MISFKRIEGIQSKYDSVTVYFIRRGIPEGLGQLICLSLALILGGIVQNLSLQAFETGCIY